jgi:hypothetical protein
MAGQLTPLVLLPRYTTYVGASTFVSIAMDVTEYSAAIINVWRGILLGTTPSIVFNFQESTDQVTWDNCAGYTPDFDPGEEDEEQVNVTLTKRWFRITILLGGTSPAATCWAVGFLEQRES